MPVTGVQLNQHCALVVTPTLTKTNTTVSVGGVPAIPLFGGSGWIDNAESNMSVYTMPLTHNTASYNFTNPAGLIVLCYGSGISVSYYYSAGFATRNLSAAFTANNIPYTELHNNPFCEHDITFIANIEGINSNPGSLKWYIDDPGQLSPLHIDETSWSQNFLTGNHVITMSVFFEDNSTETYQDTLKIAACEAAFYANNVHYIPLENTTLCDKVVTFLAEVEGLHPDPGSLKWYINGVEETAEQDQLTWFKEYPNGLHPLEVIMEVRYANGETETITCNFTVKVFWTSIKNIRH
jgi:hypothetical protein